MLVTALTICALSVAAVLLLAAYSYSCSNVTVFVWPTVVRCAVPASVVLRAVDEIVRADDGAALVGPKGAGLLEDIAREAGPSTVACALHQLTKIYRAGEPSALQLERAARAERFLRDRDITVEGDP